MICHPLHRPVLVAAFALGLQFATDACAGVQAVGVQKLLWYLQTSDRGVYINTQDNAYTFEAAVWGTALSGMTPPALAGPINTALVGPSYNGRMTLGAGKWNLVGVYRSQQDLDTRFGSGTYTVVVNGTPIPLTLAGDAYPQPPLTTFSRVIITSLDSWEPSGRKARRLP